MADPTIAELWDDYVPVSKRHDTWATEAGRAKHLIRHLGARRASQLSLREVDRYRADRLDETTARGGPPSPATLDREVELLKRIINYGVECRRVYANPIARVKLLGKSNIRKSVVKEDAFKRLHAAAAEPLKPILLVAFDTGMRLSEILRLRRDQLDLTEGCIELAAEDTKTDEPRRVYLTPRVREALGALELAGDYVFTNPKTGTHYDDVRKAFASACEAAGLPGLWFHDLRRSFATRAIKRGIPQRVVMRMTGHRSDAVFKRYNIIFDADVRDAANKLGD
jgi:integrase